MIRYSLKCSESHEFDCWFQSAAAFETMRKSGMVSCPRCGDTNVEKALMAPGVHTARKAEARQNARGQSAPTHATPSHAGTAPHALSAPSSPAEAALRELKQKIQENSEYVGRDFAAEARRIHEGEAPERSIYGEATPDDARALIEDGVPVSPLPFLPSRKAN